MTNHEKYFGTADLAASSTIEPYVDAMTRVQMVRVTHGAARSPFSRRATSACGSSRTPAMSSPMRYVSLFSGIEAASVA